MSNRTGVCGSHIQGLSYEWQWRLVRTTITHEQRAAAAKRSLYTILTPVVSTIQSRDLVKSIIIVMDLTVCTNIHNRRTYSHTHAHTHARMHAHTYGVGCG